MATAAGVGPVAPAVRALAEQHRLGSPTGVYRPKPMATKEVVAQIIAGVLMLVLVVGLWLLYDVWRRSSRNRRRAARRLQIFEHGLILVDHNGPVDWVRWDAVTAWQAISTVRAYGRDLGTNYVYTLATPDGKKRRITHFYERPEVWGPKIQQGITDAQAPGAIAAVSAGETLAFGSLTISPAGIGRGRKVLPWAEIQEIKVHQGFVHIRRAGKWLNWSGKAVSEIPNVFVFLTVAGALINNRD